MVITEATNKIHDKPAFLNELALLPVLSLLPFEVRLSEMPELSLLPFVARLSELPELLLLPFVARLSDFIVCTWELAWQTAKNKTAKIGDKIKD